MGQMQAQRFSDCMIGMPNRSRAAGAPCDARRII